MNNKVLAIDDDLDLCVLLKKNLETDGYQVSICHDGDVGFMEAVKNNYQLIVLDIMTKFLHTAHKLMGKI
jgi:DNA-binding response OmpR family regulator